MDNILPVSADLLFKIYSDKCSGYVVSVYKPLINFISLISIMGFISVKNYSFIIFMLDI